MNPITAYLKRRYKEHAASHHRWAKRDRWDQAADFAELAAGVALTLGDEVTARKWREAASMLRRRKR